MRPCSTGRPAVAAAAASPLPSPPRRRPAQTGASFGLSCFPSFDASLRIKVIDDQFDFVAAQDPVLAERRHYRVRIGLHRIPEAAAQLRAVRKPGADR